MSTDSTVPTMVVSSWNYWAFGSRPAAGSSKSKNPVFPSCVSFINDKDRSTSMLKPLSRMQPSVW